MKILIPVLGFGKGGGNRVLAQLASEFVKKGHQVDFVSPAVEAPYFPTIANIYWAQPNGKVSNDKPDRYKVKGFIQIFLSLLVGLIHLSKNNYDIIFANHSLTVYPILFSRIKGRRVYYIQAYEPEYYRNLKGLKNSIFYRLAKRSYLFKFHHVVNSHIYSNYKEIKNAPVVYPGINLSLFFPKRSYPIPDTGLKLGTIGRSEPYKGTKYILEAFRKIRLINKTAELFIAFGDKALDEEPGITILNPHGDEALANFYRSIDVYICAGTIQHGAIHYPVIESMACNTPLITTVYYPANNENCYLIAPESASSIFEAYTNLKSDQHLLLDRRKNALNDVQQFDWKLVSEKMLGIFSDLL